MCVRPRGGFLPQPCHSLQLFCSYLGARRPSRAAEEDDAFSAALPPVSPASSFKRGSVASSLSAPPGNFRCLRSAAQPSAVCVAPLHSPCVSEGRRPATRAAIQALHWAHLRAPLHVAGLSGDLARPIFIPPPPPPPYVEHRVLIDTDNGVKRQLSAGCCRSF